MCDLLKKKFVLKVIKDAKKHIPKMDKWISFTPHEHIVFTYDPIAQQDGSIIQFTDYVEASIDVVSAVQKMNIQDMNELVPKDYIRFVTEYVL